MLQVRNTREDDVISNLVSPLFLCLSPLLSKWGFLDFQSRGEVWRFRNDPILFTLQTNVEKTSTSYLASSIFWGRLEVKTGYLVTGDHDTKKQRGGESAQKVKSVEVRIVPKSP